MINITRAFVLVLVLTGAAASTQTVSAGSKTATIAPRNSMMPAPMCPPDDPNSCGFGQFSGR